MEVTALAEASEVRVGIEPVAFVPALLTREPMVFFHAGVGTNLGILVEDVDCKPFTGSAASTSGVEAEVEAVSSASIVHA